MAQINYGVILQDGCWRLVGPPLRYGRFRSRARAERAAHALARHSAGLPVNLHIQAETGELLPPKRVEPF